MFETFSAALSLTPIAVRPLNANAPNVKRPVVGMRHQLRTPLNQILGYSELLLDQAGGSSFNPLEPSLRKVVANAKGILQLIQGGLPLSGDVSDAHLAQLQQAMGGPLHEIIIEMGRIAPIADPAQVTDLLRINMAAAELLCFAEGAAPARRPDPARPAAVAPSPRAASARMLVIDDNEANLDMLRRQLERQGYTVDVAENGPDGVRKLAERPYDLVLLDIIMPQMDGSAVLRAIKSDPALRDVPVVMISALDELDAVAACIQAGADDYLTKPFDPVLLGSRIAASLDRKRLRDEEKAQSRALQRMNEDLRQFASVAGHDLQEPLRTITSYTQLLARRCEGRLDAESKGFLDLVIGAAQRMRELIDDLLALSRATVSESPALAPVQLEEVIDEVVSNLQASIQDTGALVRKGAMALVIANRLELAQVLQNLLSNAIKYRRPDTRPEIEVSAARENAGWVIGVKDNGAGIEPVYFDQIFAPFKRLHGREIPGSGIGLALCRRIIERHGGRIWVESAGPGLGSTFRFSLPLHEG